MSDVTATTTVRLATIHRAIDLIDTASPDDLDCWLAKTAIHAHLQDSPGAVRSNLAAITADSSTGQRFGAWKAAQQILKAAGQSY